MVTYTPILRLTLPIFDQDPWFEEINGNLSIIDATLGSYFGIPNFVGVWRNDTGYSVGQVVVDATDSSQWSVLVPHTSPASPTTFPDDRVANPTRWSNTVTGINALVNQAAASAAAAATSAAAAEAAALATANKVPLAGGTMTGALILSGNPVSTLGAATKAYVDAQIGGPGYLPLTGGTMSGGINMTAGTLNITPTAVQHQLGQIFVVKSVGAGVPVSYLWNVGGSVAGGWYLDSSNTLWFANFSGVGALVSNRAYLTAAGAFHAYQQITAPSITSAGSIGVNSGTVGLGTYVANQIWLKFTGDNWRLSFSQIDGSLSYVSYAGVSLFSISAAGAVGVLGGLGASFLNSSSTITAAGLITTSAGNISAPAGLIYGGTVQAGGSLQGASLTVSGDGVLANVTVSGNGYKPGGGAWADSSDERIKYDVKSYNSGLEDIINLNPVMYRKKANFKLFGVNALPIDREFIGLIAQDAEAYMPEMFEKVTAVIDNETVNDFRIYDSSALIYALVNSIKELNNRVGFLEDH